MQLGDENLRIVDSEASTNWVGGQQNKAVGNRAEAETGSMMEDRGRHFRGERRGRDNYEESRARKARTARRNGGARRSNTRVLLKCRL